LDMKIQARQALAILKEDHRPLPLQAQQLNPFPALPLPAILRQYQFPNIWKHSTISGYLVPAQTLCHLLLLRLCVISSCLESASPPAYRRQFPIPAWTHPDCLCKSHLTLCVQARTDITPPDSCLVRAGLAHLPQANQLFSTRWMVPNVQRQGNHGNQPCGYSRPSGAPPGMSGSEN